MTVATFVSELVIRAERALVVNMLYFTVLVGWQHWHALFDVARGEVDADDERAAVEAEVAQHAGHVGQRFELGHDLCHRLGAVVFQQLRRRPALADAAVDQRV